MNDEMVQAIKQGVKEAIDEAILPLYIERERHYRDHQFVTDMRNIVSNVQGTATKTIVGILITSVVGLIILGFIMWGKNHIGK